MSPSPAPGSAWLVDAYDCDASALRSLETLGTLFERIVEDLRLRPLADPVWHVFPGAGGITGVLLLSESHLACHTFPERRFAALDLYCCRPQVSWPWEPRLREVFGAGRVTISMVPRGSLTVPADRPVEGNPDAAAVRPARVRPAF